MERITAQRSSRRYDDRHFFDPGNEAGKHRNQIPPGVDMDNQRPVCLADSFKKMFQQGRGKMGMVFRDALKKINRHAFDQR